MGYNEKVGFGIVWAELYLGNKRMHLSYKGECGVRQCTCIEAFKEELDWAIDKQLWVISNAILFKTVIPLRIWRMKSF